MSKLTETSCGTIYAYSLMGTQVNIHKLHISEVSIPDQFYNLTTNIYGVCTSNAELTNTNMTEMIQNSQTYYIIIYCDVCVCCPFPLSSKARNLSSKTRYLSSSTGKQSSWACNELSSRTTLLCLFSCFTSQVNSYGHGGTVSSPNHTFS